MDEVVFFLFSPPLRLPLAASHEHQEQEGEAKRNPIPKPINTIIPPI